MRKGMRLLFLLLFVQPSLFLPLPGNPPPQPNPPHTPVIQANPGQPLPPGTVSYRNTWNQTQSQQCAYPQLPREPLSPRAGNWTIVVNIPTLLFMGKASSSSIKHTYIFYVNGTFVAQDDRGNGFAVKRLQGLPSGTVVTTLRANSTVAIQNYLLIQGSQTAANVSVSYSIRHQFCQPAGLKTRITGQVNWGATGSGTLSMTFKQAPIQAKGNRALFGNKSGIQIGFDWNDSRSFSPAF